MVLRMAPTSCGCSWAHWAVWAFILCGVVLLTLVGKGRISSSAAHLCCTQADHERDENGSPGHCYNGHAAAKYDLHLDGGASRGWTFFSGRPALNDTYKLIKTLKNPKSRNRQLTHLGRAQPAQLPQLKQTCGSQLLYVSGTCPADHCGRSGL